MFSARVCTTFKRLPHLAGSRLSSPVLFISPQSPGRGPSHQHSHALHTFARADLSEPENSSSVFTAQPKDGTPLKPSPRLSPPAQTPSLGLGSLSDGAQAAVS